VNKRDIGMISYPWVYDEMNTKRKRKKRIFRGRFNIDYCPMRARRTRHQTNPFARKIPSVHVYVFIHESHVFRTIRRKNEYTLKEDKRCVHTEFYRKKKNRWKPIDTEKVGKPRNKIAVPKKNQKPDNAEKLRGVERLKILNESLNPKRRESKNLIS